MAVQLKETFSSKNQKNEPVFVTFLTAGYPTVDDTVPLMLSMQAGGADIIELGNPFSDPIADGVVIQAANNVAIENGVDYKRCIQFVKEARAQGLTIPVLIMGYYNPILSFGEEEAVVAAKKAGANGFIVVDLPPEEAVKFRGLCTKEGLSYVPLIAPSTTDARIQFLASIADSFMYVVSRMGTTGSSAYQAVSESLPALVARVKSFSNVPVAVGFGVATRSQFDYVSNSGSDGVVIGSKIINLVTSTPGGISARAKALEEYCREVSTPTGGSQVRTSFQPAEVSFDLPKYIVPDVVEKKNDRFGEFGGAYVPEALTDCLRELEEGHKAAVNDPAFWKEFQDLYGYINRPSQLYFAERMTEEAGGARIWLKREDLNHTGSHKINNALGQILLARRLGKTRIIADTGAGQHGVATATACAKFGLKCDVYMGAEDMRRQALNVFRMKMLGANVIPVTSGTKTLKDAVSEAFRNWVTELSTTHFCIGSAVGPHPFPTIVRDFQKVIGQEIRLQLQEKRGKLPDAVVACVGGGSNAIGTFYDFIGEESVRLVGIEPGGDGVGIGRHAATLVHGKPGVLHGVKTYVLQTDAGQIVETHSISAGLDYAGVGPEHAFLKDSLRAEYRVADDEQALRGFRMCTQLEGIIPALESSHAVWGGVQLAKTLGKDQDVVICLSGRGDKDVEELHRILPGKWADKLDWHINA